MGLEDRDWYRKEPSKAWRTRWDPSPSSPGSGGGRTTRGPLRIFHAAWLAMLVSAALAAAAYWHVIPGLQLGDSRSPTAERLAIPNGITPPPVTISQSKIVRLGTKPGFDTKARRVSRWWITDPRFGTVSVYVPVGQTPRKALTIALAERGYQVVP